jgi:hypothetical protein
MAAPVPVRPLKLPEMEQGSDAAPHFGSKPPLTVSVVSAGFESIPWLALLPSQSIAQ